MKRAIFVIIFFTIAVTLTPFYLQWQESRRLKRISEVKQQARPVFGEKLETVLTEFKSGTPPSIIILYTGGTKSHLEPCGCYQEQSGGLSRRAYVIEQIRQQGIQTLLVDAGDIFDGTETIDSKRCQVNLKAMSMMGYDAVALSQNDLAYDDLYLTEHRQYTTFPFLAQTRTGTQPFLRKKLGDLSVMFLGTMGQRLEHFPTADLLIALGIPAEVEYHDIDVVIRPDDIEATESEACTLSVGSKPEGKTLGVLALWLNAAGERTRYHATHIALTGDVSESKSVRQLLSNFYKEVSQAAEHLPLFASQFLETQARNEYVSATACRSCHEQEYLQWSSTRHAFAFETLLKKERYFDPSCVSCHTTGFAYQTGFQIGDETTSLKGVQCETCHGPGKQHIRNPKQSNIRRADDLSLCLECHDTKHSPGFEDIVALHVKDVDHTREPMNLEELLASRVSRMGKPTLELFVMSYCPFSVQAEEKLIPIVKDFGDTIDFKLQFIAQEKEQPSPQDITPFTSLHGYPEVAEDIRQVLIAEAYPDQYLDYVLCRGKNLDESWKYCAQKLGINVEKILALFDTSEAEQLFRDNIKRSVELGVRTSPTIFVDNHQFQTNQLLGTSGASCQ